MFESINFHINSEIPGCCGPDKGVEIRAEEGCLQGNYEGDAVAEGTKT